MSYQITVRPSGREFQAEADETLLTAAIRQGIGLPYGCKNGACGSCKCLKLEGSVTHRAHQQKALSSEEQAQGYVLTCCCVAESSVVLESRQVTSAGTFPILKMPARVFALERLGHDVMRVTLQLPASNVLQFHAGQYIEFILRDGSRRSYSMANAPQEIMRAPSPGASPVPMVDLHIRHMPGGLFTDQVFGSMKARDIMRIEGPFGSFFLREDSDKPIVLLASGTGFAPIKALLEHMQAKSIARPVALYWGGRRPHDLYMSDWVDEAAEHMPNLRYVPVISNAQPEDGWSGRTGFVHLAVLQDLPDLSAYQVYACGTPLMVDSARAEFSAQAGLPEWEFYADAFTSEADKTQTLSD